MELVKLNTIFRCSKHEPQVYTKHALQNFHGTNFLPLKHWYTTQKKLCDSFIAYSHMQIIPCVFQTIKQSPVSKPTPTFYKWSDTLTCHLRIIFWSNYWVGPLLPNYAKSAKQHTKPVRVKIPANGPRTTRFSSHYYILCMGTWPILDQSESEMWHIL
jgi:hypothetical protein